MELKQSVSRRKITACKTAVLLLAGFCFGCDSKPPRNPYFEVQPGASFSQWQLQCAVNAFVEQREASQQIEHRQRCEERLPRLELLQKELRDDWIAEQRSKWEARCAKEIPSLREACRAKADEVIRKLPDHLRVPPIYSNILVDRPVEVTPGIWRNVQFETDIKETAAKIVMDRVEADARVWSSLLPPSSDSSAPRIERSQRERDLTDIHSIGYCARWIGRDAPDGTLVTEEHLDQEIASCVAQ